MTTSHYSVGIMHDRGRNHFLGAIRNVKGRKAVMMGCIHNLL